MYGHIPLDKMEALYRPIGVIVIAWSMIDVATANVVSVVYRSGGHAKEKQVPRQMKRKVIFLRRCFRQIDGLSNFAQEGLALLADIQKLKAYREGIAHGYPAQYDPDTGRYNFYSLEIEDDAGPGNATHRLVGRYIDIPHLIKAGAQSTALARKVAPFMSRIVDAWERKEIGQDGIGGVTV